MKNIFLLIIGFLLIAAGVFIYLNMPPAHMEDEIFIIEKGETLRSVAGSLKGKNLIRNETFFIYLAILQGDSKVLTGTYNIFRNMTSREIIKRLSSGEVITKKITIPEGYNLYEIAELLEENKITSGKDFLEYSFDREFLDSINIFSISAEGLLFPDTYVFPENRDARDIIIAMHKQFQNVIYTIDLSPLETLKLDNYELIILASLIEKEAKVPRERQYISAVFHNRLERNMTLGCDPTVRYAVKKFKGSITYADLKHDSPYNTYIHAGLPPTPICSPGRESILAALDPIDTNYLYFVARNDGSHYFSKTLKEHNRAVDFYQKGINNGFIDDQEL